MTLPSLQRHDTPEQFTDPKTGIVYERYSDPLAPEPANPHRFVDGRFIQLTICTKADTLPPDTED
jgi:hypothetical protein